MVKPILIAMGVLAMAGCESVHLGMGLPVPGPVKPHVGMSVNKDGVKGHAGASAKAGPVPLAVGGSTKPIKPEENER